MAEMPARRFKAFSLLLGVFTFGVAAVWTVAFLSFTTIPMTIGGSGLSESIVHTLTRMYYGAAVLNGAIIVLHLRWWWLTVVAVIAYMLAHTVRGTEPDLYVLYFVVVLTFSLVLIGATYRWIAGLLR